MSRFPPSAASKAAPPGPDSFLQAILDTGSRLIQALTYADEALQMPPGGKLPDETIEAFPVLGAGMGADPRTEAATVLPTAQLWSLIPPCATSRPKTRPHADRPLHPSQTGRCRSSSLPPKATSWMPPRFASHGPTAASDAKALQSYEEAVDGLLALALTRRAPGTPSG